MHKTNFRVSDKDQTQTNVRVKAAQKFALDFTEHDIKSYSQWFPSKKNIVADALFCNDNRNDDKLTSILYRFCPPSDAQPFQKCTTAKQNCLVADLAAVEAAHQGAVQGSTHKNQAIGCGQGGTNILN